MAALLAGIFAVAEDGRLTMMRSFPSWRISRCALLNVERLLPYGDRHDYGGRAGGLGQRALETVGGPGPLTSSVVIVLLASAVAIDGSWWSKAKTAPFCATIMIAAPYDYTSPLSGMRSYIKNP